MSHITHIASKKKQLHIRAEVIHAIRTFFYNSGVMEISAPAFVAYPGQEPNLEPIQVCIQDEKGNTFDGYLHTSPEYTLKKCIAAGLGDVYFLGFSYRNKESFGGLHNPEFTMLEWYRVGATMTDIMDDLDALFTCISTILPDTIFSKPITRVHMRDAWQTYAGVQLDDYLTLDAMRELVVRKGHSVDASDTYEILFYTIFLNEIEPHLGIDAPVIVHHYPASMAALSRISEVDSRYAERFEVYVQGVELANAFSELTDANEQGQRLLEEKKERAARGMSVYDLDKEFLVAVEQLPACAGIAFGIDRFVQVLLGCQNIDDVLVLPCSKMFE